VLSGTGGPALMPTVAAGLMAFLATVFAAGTMVLLVITMLTARHVTAAAFADHMAVAVAGADTSGNVAKMEMVRRIVGAKAAAGAAILARAAAVGLAVAHARPVAGTAGTGPATVLGESVRNWLYRRIRPVDGKRCRHTESKDRGDKGNASAFENNSVHYNCP